MNFTLRAPADDDVRALVGLLGEAQLRVGEESTACADDILDTWRAPGYDREVFARVADVGGEIAGHVRRSVQVGSDEGELVFRGYVAAAHRGKGIGTALVRWALETFRSQPALRKAFTDADAGDSDAIALFESFGFEHARSFYWMLHADPSSVPEPFWPPGIGIDNTLRGEDLVQAIVTAHDGSFVDHFGFHPLRPDGARHLITQAGFGPELVFIARRGNEIAGFCICTIHRSHSVCRGEVFLIGTTRPFRGIGLGRALLRHGIRELARRGSHEIGIGVDTDNPSGAVGFYERTGFRVRRETRVFSLDS